MACRIHKGTLLPILPFTGCPNKHGYKKINKQILNSSRQNNRGSAFLAGIIMLNQKLIYKNEIKIVTELSWKIFSNFKEKFEYF